LENKPKKIYTHRAKKNKCRTAAAETAATKARKTTGMPLNTRQ